MKIAVIGNALPRRCGIATFTDNLTKSVLQAIHAQGRVDSLFMVAMNDPQQEYDYSDEVAITIRQQERADYLEAADRINASGADLCLIQHEFGIYGGESGLYLLSLMRELKMPIVATLHTILQTPSYHERNIIHSMGMMCQRLVVMSKLAVNFLTTIYQVPLQKIAIIHHGVPDFGQITGRSVTMERYNGRRIISTFGFLGRSKGIEVVIQALPNVVKEHPNVLYVVLGQTHPHVKRHAGESYREYLKALAVQLGVQEHVVFEDGFFAEDELKRFLREVDIYITPYLNECQITSGTLSYALGAGACIVSTPFWHACELLADGRGTLFPFSDNEQLSVTLTQLFDQPKRIQHIKAKAFAYGQQMYWDHVGRVYLSLFDRIVQQPVSVSIQPGVKKLSDLPRLSLAHLRRLTDDTGIVEHANYSIPDLREGYSLDDNARAILLVAILREFGLESQYDQLADVYLRYIRLMQQPNGWFNNDLSFDRRLLDDGGSPDSFGRTIWAMGTLIRIAPCESHFQFAKDVFFRAMPHFTEVRSIRAVAGVILGLTQFLKRYPDHEHVMHLLHTLSMRLVQQYRDESDQDWAWFEPVLCYDNALLPLALWESYSINRDSLFREVAMASTQFLDRHVFRQGRLSLVGNQGWFKKDEQSFPGGQQPIDALGMVMLYHRVASLIRDPSYEARMLTAFTWFTGNNDLMIPLYDEETAGCCDGLEVGAVNRNQGAESILAYLTSYAIVYAFLQNQQQHLKQTQEAKLVQPILSGKIDPFALGATLRAGA